MSTTAPTTPADVATEKPADRGSAAEIASFVSELSDTMTVAIDEINDINSNTQLLALNARIEAARAGSAGAA
ncbi:MAG: methyl-accepting chemotaxis protein, partial [Planctomycetota bacterium]